MKRTPAMSRIASDQWWIGTLPFVAILGLWFIAPAIAHIPAYKLPSVAKVTETFIGMVRDGSLFLNVGSSLLRLGIGFVIGNAIAIPLGLLIGMNRNASETLQPVLGFFQSVAGIAWVPLAIIWFGVGNGPVLFVIANTIFFSSIYNTIMGVQSIPAVFHRAVKCHGGNNRDVLINVVIPGAFIQILVGLRTSMAYGWRALVAAEMIAGTSGIGYITLQAVQWYETSVVIVGLILVGVLWLILDRLIFVPIEKATVRRWGILRQ